MDPEGYQIKTYVVKARCRRDERVVSGGFTTNRPVNKGVSFFDASHKVGGRTWRVRVSTFIRSKINAYAYCEEK